MNEENKTDIIAKDADRLSFEDKIEIMTEMFGDFDADTQKEMISMGLGRIEKTRNKLSVKEKEDKIKKEKARKKRKLVNKQKQKSRK
jgi:hypothetical protein